MRIARAVLIDSSQRETLQQWARSRSLPARQIERARIVLLAAEGKTDLEIAASLNISNQKAARWRKRSGGRAWLQPLQVHNLGGGATDHRQIPERSAHESVDRRSGGRAGSRAGEQAVGLDQKPDRIGSL